MYACIQIALMFLRIVAINVCEPLSQTLKMPTREENLELKPESLFVTKESFREELDLVKNNLKFVRSQTFNKRQCQGALGIFIILSVAANIVLGFLLYMNQVCNIIY